jgi:hypothetical protein
VSHPDTYDRMGEKNFRIGGLSKMDLKEVIRSDRGAIKEIDFSSEKNTATGLVALCFKVPFKFRQDFKLQSLRRGMTMTELLVFVAESYIDVNRIQPPTNTEIRK